MMFYSTTFGLTSVHLMPYSNNDIWLNVSTFSIICLISYRIVKLNSI